MRYDNGVTRKLFGSLCLIAVAAIFLACQPAAEETAPSVPSMKTQLAKYTSFRLETDLGVPVSVVHFLNGDSVSRLAAALRDHRSHGGQDRPDAHAPDPAELSDADVDRLLSRFLPSEAK